MTQLSLFPCNDIRWLWSSVVERKSSSHLKVFCKFDLLELNTGDNSCVLKDSVTVYFILVMKVDWDRISPYHINTISSRQVKRIKKLSITGLFFDPISNSLNQHHKNCMADSKENYQWDLGGEWVKPWGFHQVPLICLPAGIQVYFRAEKCLNNYGCYVLLLPMPPHLTRACNLYSVSGNINVGDINLFYSPGHCH